MLKVFSQLFCSYFKHAVACNLCVGLFVYVNFCCCCCCCCFFQTSSPHPPLCELHWMHISAKLSIMATLLGCVASPCLSLSLLHWRQENLRLYLAFVDASSGQEESFWVREWGGSWGCGGCWNDRGDRESKKEDVWIASLEWTLQTYFSRR